MLRLTLMATFFISLSATAHVLPGSYKGADQNGNPCAFTVGEVWFEDGMEHPLTERLPVSHISFNGKPIDGVIWNLGHPPVVNTEVGVNRYNHDIFQQIVPTKVGANSVTLLKVHEKEEESKPVGIIFIEDIYRSKPDSKKMTCLL